MARKSLCILFLLFNTITTSYACGGFGPASKLEYIENNLKEQSVLIQEAATAKLAENSLTLNTLDYKNPHHVILINTLYNLIGGPKHECSPGVIGM